MQRITVVDIFRGVAILITLAIHLGPIYITLDYPWLFPNTVWFKLWTAGGYGVSMFFLISGYLITRVIAAQPDGLFRPDFRDFYSRRVGRILPLLILVCLLGASVLPFIPPDQAHALRYLYCVRNPAPPFSWALWLSIALFCFNWYKTFRGGSSPYFGLHWDVLWSLSIEEQFYSFYPPLLKRLGGAKRLALFLGFMVILNPLVNLVAHETYPRWHTWNSFGHFGLMAYGCLLFLAEGAFQDRLASRPRTCWALVALGSLLMSFILFHSPAKVYVWLPIWGETIMGLGLFLLLLGGLHLDFFKSKWWLPLTLPGRLSYGMYLFHPLVLFALWPVFSHLHHFLAWGLYCLITAALAWLSFYYYEKPMNRLFRRGFFFLYDWAASRRGRIDLPAFLSLK